MTMRVPAGCLAFVAALFSTGAIGQTSNPASNSNLQNTLPKPPPPRSRTTANLPAQSAADLPALREVAVHPTKFNIAGIHAVPFDEVAALFQPLLNTDTTIGALTDAAKKVSEVYARHGYALSYGYVPVQDPSSGVVQLVVVEGYIAGVTLKNAPPRLEAKIRKIAAHMVNERPLRKATFERYVSLVARLPGVGVDANVPVPDKTSGATTLELALRFEKYDASAAFDANHPGFEGILSGTVNGLTPLGDQLGASVMWPRGRYDRSYRSVDYALPIGSNGLAVRLNAYSYEGKDSSFLFNDVELRKAYADRRASVSLSYPIVLTAATTVIGEATLYRSSSGDRYTAPPDPEVLDLRANVRAMQLSLSGGWQHPSYATEAAIQLAKGSKGYGASQLEDLIDLDFTRVRANARRNDNWQGGKFKTSLSALVQHSGDHLPASEKISFGGTFYAAAFPTGDVAGDSGWAVAGEVSKPIAFGKRQLEPFAGFDVQRVRTNGDDFNRGTLGSAILGTRLAVSPRFAIALAAAKPVGGAPLGKDGRPWRFTLQGSASL